LLYDNSFISRALSDNDTSVEGWGSVQIGTCFYEQENNNNCTS